MTERISSTFFYNVKTKMGAKNWIIGLIAFYLYIRWMQKFLAFKKKCFYSYEFNHQNIFPSFLWLYTIFDLNCINFSNYLSYSINLSLSFSLSWFNISITYHYFIPLIFISLSLSLYIYIYIYICIYIY